MQKNFPLYTNDPEEEYLRSMHKNNLKIKVNNLEINFFEIFIGKTRVTITGLLINFFPTVRVQAIFTYN